MYACMLYLYLGASSYILSLGVSRSPWVQPRFPIYDIENTGQRSREKSELFPIAGYLCVIVAVRC